MADGSMDAIDDAKKGTKCKKKPTVELLIVADKDMNWDSHIKHMMVKVDESDFPGAVASSEFVLQNFITIAENESKGRDYKDYKLSQYKKLYNPYRKTIRFEKYRNLKPTAGGKKRRRTKKRSA
jgi:hypothetical protein